MEVDVPYHHGLSTFLPRITEVNRRYIQPHDHSRVVSPVSATRDTAANSTMSVGEECRRWYKRNIGNAFQEKKQVQGPEQNGKYMQPTAFGAAGRNADDAVAVLKRSHELKEILFER